MFPQLLDALSHLCYLALHVLSGGSFPKPLTPERERELLLLLHEQKDSEARRLLIEHNLRLVAHLVKKYYGSSYDQDDLVSIGTIGLIKAVDTFNPTKGSRLATYASRCIENEIRMHLRANKKAIGDMHIEDPIDSDSDGNPLTWLDVLSQEDADLVEGIELRLLSQRLYRYIPEVLDDREREIIELRYGLRRSDELTQREVAKHLDISRSYVSRIEKRALEKLHHRFEQRS